MENTVILIGRMGKDPERKTSENGTLMARFSLATERYTKENGERKKVADWHYCTAFGSAAEIIQAYGAKGRSCYVSGTISYYPITDDKGNQKKAASIIVNKIRFLDKAPNDAEQKTQQPAANASYSAAKNFGLEPLDDDIPFFR